MSNRTIVTRQGIQNTRRMTYELEDILRSGGFGYETRSAIWAYSPRRRVVSLFVKNPQPGMSNDIIEYHKDSKNFERHYDRIVRLCEE